MAATRPRESKKVIEGETAGRQDGGKAGRRKGEKAGIRRQLGGDLGGNMREVPRRKKGKGVIADSCFAAGSTP